MTNKTKKGFWCCVWMKKEEQLIIHHVFFPGDIVGGCDGNGAVSRFHMLPRSLTRQRSPREVKRSARAAASGLTLFVSLFCALLVLNVSPVSAAGREWWALRRVSGGTEATATDTQPLPGFVSSSNPDLCRFSEPRGLAVKADGSMAYVADFNNNAIRSITLNPDPALDGACQCVIAQASCPKTSSDMYLPEDVTFTDATETKLFVASTCQTLFRFAVFLFLFFLHFHMHKICVFVLRNPLLKFALVGSCAVWELDIATQTMVLVVGEKSSSTCPAPVIHPAKFANVRAIRARGNDVYILDHVSNRITKFDRAASTSTLLAGRWLHRGGWDVSPNPTIAAACVQPQRSAGVP